MSIAQREKCPVAPGQASDTAAQES